MKVKIKLKIDEFNELVTVATAFTKDKFFIRQWSNIQKINLRSFIFFGAKKQIEWACNNELKNKVKTISLDVNYIEALRLLFNLHNQMQYAKAIFYSITEQVNKQVNEKLIILQNYE